MITALQTLYKRDSNGNVRQLTIEYCDGIMNGPVAGTRSISGIMGGKLVESAWNVSVPMNVGRSNETSAIQQAEKEAKATWAKKEEKEYFVDIMLIDTYEKFKPQLADDYTKRPQTSGYSQPKLDGIRCIARKDGLYTRAGKHIPTCAHIEHALKPFFDSNPDFILDGELYNHDLKDDFNQITSLVRKLSSEEGRAASLVQYHIYDCMSKDFPDMLFTDRNKFTREWLTGLMDDVYSQAMSGFNYLQTCLVIVPTIWCENQEQLDGAYASYMAQGYEGQMVRNNTPYENKRSKNLLKRKQFVTDEFKVVHVLEGKGNWAGYAKHFELELGDGRVFRSGVRGNQALMKELLEQTEPPTWVTCRYFELTPDGVPRFPVVIDWGTGERND